MEHGEHLGDEELMLLIDGEADPASAAQWQAHVSACAGCASKKAELESALTRWLNVRSVPVVPIDRQRVQHLNGRISARRRQTIRYALAACLMAAIAGGVLWNTHLRAPVGPLPDARLTPGAARALTRAEVCGLASEDEQRQVPVELARRVFREYRIASPRARAYEVDYLISPALGGSEEVSNLWPQPYAEGVWNSRVKDALEDDLRRQVCAGTLELKRVQEELAHDWIATYKRHFRTERPLAGHRVFIKDRAWE